LQVDVNMRLRSAIILAVIISGACGRTWMPQGGLADEAGTGGCGGATDAERRGVFAPTGSMNVGRASHAATSLPSGRVLISGGYDDLASAELYDPVAGGFAATGSMNVERASHTATLLPNANVLVTGGLDADQVQVESAELYE
jgi:hypothetical protein